MFGVSEKNLMASDRARLEEQRKQWEAEDRINQQKEHDTQIAAQLQLDEQRRADRPVQMGPAGKTVAPSMEEEVRQAKQALKLQVFTLEIVTHSSDEDAEDQRSALLTHHLAKQVAKEMETDHERAHREWELQAMYRDKRAKLSEAPMEQLLRDTEELAQIKVEENRLQAVKQRARAGSEEARQCDLGLDALRGQKEVLFRRLTERLAEPRRPLPSEEGEEPSTVEIMMDTSEMDMTIVKQGRLPIAAETIEDKVYKRLVSFEMNDIQWRYDALSYLT